MVHPVKTPLGAVRTVTLASLNAVRHPLRTAGDAVTLGRGIVGAVVTGYQHDTSGSPVDSQRPVAQAAPSPAGNKRQGDPLAASATEEAAPTTAEPTAPVEEPEHHQVVTEPSAVTGPGDAEEIPSPADPLEDDEDVEDVEVITPVGTTGAGPAVNPDTTESDLQQPGTEPLMDPATTKRIKRETETLRKASDRKKG